MITDIQMPATPQRAAEHNVVLGNMLEERWITREQYEAALENTPVLAPGAVQDEGEGIAPEQIPHLTRRFYRTDPGRSRASGGTGLGLAIVKHIVERHRGRLDISSELGKGTRVVVRIPLAEQEKPAATEAQSEEDSGPREAETQQLS